MTDDLYIKRYMKQQQDLPTQSGEAGGPRVSLGELASSLDGGFPGHTMRRMRMPDGRYRYTYVSPGVRETFGFDPDILTAPDGVAHDWVHPDDRPRFLDALERSAVSLDPFDEEVRVRIADGSFKWIRSMGQPRRLVDGTVIWDGVALDVTDRHHALSSIQNVLTKARRDEASQSRMASIAAQDLARPLAVMKALALDLASDPSQQAERERLDALVAAVREMELAIDAAMGLLGSSWQETEPGPQMNDRRERDADEPETLAGLTTRQRQVLTLVRQGLSNRDIAETLDIKEGTVKLHVSALLRQLGARNRTEAVRLAGSG